MYPGLSGRLRTSVRTCTSLHGGISQTLSKKLCDAIGVTLIHLPLASAELLRGFVGFTEELIRSVFGRGWLIPHLQCALMIDEIDAIAPNRLDKSGQGAGEHKVRITNMRVHHRAFRSPMRAPPPSVPTDRHYERPAFDVWRCRGCSQRVCFRGDKPLRRRVL